MTPTVLFLFAICAAGPDPASPTADRCEQGEVRTTDCTRAEAYVRAGMRPGQTLHISGCLPE